MSTSIAISVLTIVLAIVLALDDAISIIVALNKIERAIREATNSDEKGV